MKNYTNLLSNEDLTHICGLIGGKSIKEFFKKNPKAFNKLRPGFRPESLSVEEVFNIVVTNKNLLFINNYLNEWIENCLLKISEGKKCYIDENISKDMALIKALSLSVFKNRPDLYFTLSGQPCPILDSQLLYKVIEITRQKEALDSKECTVDSKPEDMDKALKELKAKHLTEMKIIEEKHEAVLVNEKLKMVGLQESVNYLEKELASKAEEILTLKNELKDYRELAKFKIADHKIAPIAGYPYMSLCKVYTDENGRSRLFRLADVFDSEFSHGFYSDVTHNRYLYNGHESLKDGYIGIWSWNVEPNRNDPSKDFITTKYNDSIKISEIIIDNDCNDLIEVVEKLKEGIPIDCCTDGIVFAVDNGTYCQGIYCNKANFDRKGKKICFKPDILKIPVYEIAKKDIFYTNDITVMMEAKLGMPSRMVKVKEPLEIVKNMILSRITWSTTQQEGFVRSEYKHIKKFLQELKTEDLYDDICRLCDCTLEEAREYVEAFNDLSENVIFGKTLENEVMAQVIRNDATLYASCMEKLTQDWEKTNQEKIEAAKLNLEGVKIETSQFNEQCEELKKRYDRLVEKIADIQTDIAKQENLAQDVQKRVVEKIEQARNNAAEFIAENAFIHINTVAQDNLSAEAEIADNRIQSTFFHSLDYSNDDAEQHDDYTQLLQTIEIELIEAGVAESVARELSAIMYAAYINRIPLLLAGPNGKDIVTAFNVSLNLHTPAILNCSGDFNKKTILDCESSSEDTVVIIEHAFRSDWKDNIINLLSKRDRFYILTHPFSEDLIIEPRSLFNYCVPILTEMVIEKFPTGKYIGGYSTEKFEPFVSKEINKHYDKLLKSIHVGSIAKLNLQRLISDSRILLNSKKIDMEFKILLYSIVFTLGEQEALLEWLENGSPKPSKEICELLQYLIGEPE